MPYGSVRLGSLDSKSLGSIRFGSVRVFGFQILRFGSVRFGFVLQLFVRADSVWKRRFDFLTDRSVQDLPDCGSCMVG